MNEYQETLKRKMDEYVHFVYKVTKKFPKEEIYGTTSQFRRSSLSVILNYIEGYARRKPLVRLNFLETSYESLKESKYLLEFCKEEKYLDKQECEFGTKLTEEIGAMLWREMKHLDDRNI
ncbi:MAG: four helix bundle protein [Candidatus Paceibacterota bacterium]